MNLESQFTGVILVILMIMLALYGLFCQIGIDFAPQGQMERQMVIVEGNSLLPISPIIFPKTQVLGTITSYNPTEEQCDSTPDITASGKKVSEGMIANNCLPFGTRVEINGIIYTVEDRMNSRYGCDRFDILSFDEEFSIEFGRQKHEVIIY
jgi:3D (Asp-Asp-Asp) domain-containing protein